jgi:hypothetical protein
MAIYHVSLGFAQLPDADLDAFTENVIASMTGNPAFPTPIVPMADLETAGTNFKDALAATVQGGTLATANKDAARAALVALLRQEANYVQGIANNNQSTLLSSGFDSVTTSNTQSPLDTPTILTILNGTSGQLTLRVEPVHNARAYEVRKSSAPGVWQPAATSTQARRVVVPDLTPGTNYTFQVRAVGGSTGFSGWSDPVSHMAT